MNSVPSGSLPGMTDDDLPALGAPATRALAGAGITRLSQVTERTAAELAALHGVGPKAIGLLQQALAERGLSFRR
jgi:predicted flap endonuclease-1-like 5' DNA nuclease